MKFLILFGVVAAFAATLAIWSQRKLGEVATVLIGAALSIATVVLFFLNKSDSVADTFLEKLADVSPPLVTGSLVIGWWVGYALYEFYQRMTR